VGKWQTIGLLTHSARTPAGVAGVTELGGGVRLEPAPALIGKAGFPEWLERCLGSEDFDLAGYAFVTEYEASGFGDRDPGDPNSTKQDAARMRLQLASIALWLSGVAYISFSAYAHAPLEMEGGAQHWHASRIDPLLPHDGYAGVPLDAIRQRTVQEITGPLLAVSRPSPLFSALRFLVFGLRHEIGEARIALLWIALEALFGEIDPNRGVSKELYRRIAGFFGMTRNEQLAAYDLAKDGWRVRCRAVHGGRVAAVTPEDRHERILEAEAMLRTALNRILRDPILVQTFSDDSRREVFAASKSAEFRAQDGMSGGPQSELQ
jgi:hypothetical protein